MIVFRARPVAAPTSSPRVTLTPTPRARAPRFLASWEARSSGWRDSLKTLITRVPLHGFQRSIELFRQTPVAPFRFMGRPLSFSLLLHFARFLVLPFLLAFSGSKDANSYMASEQPDHV